MEDWSLRDELIHDILITPKLHHSSQPTLTRDLKVFIRLILRVHGLGFLFLEQWYGVFVEKHPQAVSTNDRAKGNVN